MRYFKVFIHFILYHILPVRPIRMNIWQGYSKVLLWAKEQLAHLQGAGYSRFSRSPDYMGKRVLL